MAPSTRERILEEADGLFGESGFDATTTREIAQRAGVNKALIHYHFESKDGVLAVLLDRYYERLSETLQDALRGEGTVRDRLQRLVARYIDFLVANRNFARIVQREASGGRHMRTVKERMEPLFVVGTTLLKSAWPATQSGPLDAGQLLLSFYGIIISYFSYGEVSEQLLGSDLLSDGAVRKRKEHVAMLVDLVVAGIEAQTRDEESHGDVHGE
jgi:AcrR family transcriptional regulator